MTTLIRAAVSENNKYHIDKHRHYELKHFCLQYPRWKKEYKEYTDIGPNLSRFEALYSGNSHSDPVFNWVAKREYYAERIKLVEQAAMDTDTELWSYILTGVTNGVSYTYLKNILQIPCSRDTYYRRYRKFFWILNELRD